MQLHIQWLFPLLVELVRTPNDDVRAALAGVLSKSVAQLLPLHQR